VAPQPIMTVAGFVENVFVPEHVVTKTLSGRTHYQAILKHVLTPEEVNRVFQVDGESSRTKLKAVPDWPYLGNVPLRDIRPDHVQQLISAALGRGYSTQTAQHIRNVVSVMFEYARRRRLVAGDNPASHVTLPDMARKESHVLTLAQAKEVLAAMHYPEKEMTLIAILTSMNVAEICGLQWKRVNLTEAWSTAEGETLPPGSIAVRKQWYRCQLGSVKKGRSRILQIPEPLLPVLLELSRRSNHTGPDDFVFVSRAGTPVNENNIAGRRLKAIGQDLQMPWLSWHVFLRTHTALAYELGRHLMNAEVMRTSKRPAAVAVGFWI